MVLTSHDNCIDVFALDVNKMEMTSSSGTPNYIDMWPFVGAWLQAELVPIIVSTVVWCWSLGTISPLIMWEIVIVHVGFFAHSVCLWPALVSAMIQVTFSLMCQTFWRNVWKLVEIDGITHNYD